MDPHHNHGVFICQRFRRSSRQSPAISWISDSKLRKLAAICWCREFEEAWSQMCWMGSGRSRWTNLSSDSCEETLRKVTIGWTSLWIIAICIRPEQTQYSVVWRVVSHWRWRQKMGSASSARLLHEITRAWIEGAFKGFLSGRRFWIISTTGNSRMQLYLHTVYYFTSLMKILWKKGELSRESMPAT